MGEISNKELGLNTSILFLVFNRLDTTKQVFQEIKKAKPRQLFIAADGPRTKEEKKKTDPVRKYVLDNIDWKCSVKKLFRKKNLGCKYAVSGAINWFFENVEQGIILEDDCLPSQSFFRFCEELLEKYKDDKRVMSISGNNQLNNSKRIKNSYYFSNYPLIWGWATWKRAWRYYDVEMKKYSEIKKKKKLNEIYPNFLERIFRTKRIKDGKNSTWDIQWSFSHKYYGKFSIIPKHNLVRNIGFSKDSTHTKQDRVDNFFIENKLRDMNFPLNHSKEIKLNRKEDLRYVRKNLLRAVTKKFIGIFIK